MTEWRDRATAISGRRFSIPVTLTNNGNVPAVGNVTYSIVASTNDTFGDSDDVALSPIVKRVSIKNARSKRVMVPVTLPTLSGSYRFFVTADFAGTTLADTVTANNRDITDNAVTIA